MGRGEAWSGDISWRGGAVSRYECREREFKEIGW